MPTVSAVQGLGFRATDRGETIFRSDCFDGRITFRHLVLRSTMLAFADVPPPPLASARRLTPAERAELAVRLEYVSCHTRA